MSVNRLWMGVICLAISVTSACTDRGKNETKESRRSESSGIESSGIESRGESKIKPQTRRVISLAPSHTEWVFKLGGEDSLVGRTDQCDYPSGVKNVPSVGGLFPAQIERILAKEPTDVLMISGHHELRAQLERFGVKVHQYQPKTLSEIYTQVESLSRLFGEESSAHIWIKEAKAERERLKIPPKRPRVLVEVWFSPLTIAGSTSYMGDLVRVAGGQLMNEIKGDWPAVHLESVITFNPQVLFISTLALYQQLMSEEPPVAWKQIDAVKNHRIYLLDGRLARPSPRVIEEMKWVNQRLLGQ